MDKVKVVDLDRVKADNKIVVDRLVRVMKTDVTSILVREMDLAIIGTPTGKRRELLTEANILLLEAEKKLKEAIEQE